MEVYMRKQPICPPSAHTLCASHRKLFGGGGEHLEDAELWPDAPL